MAYLRLIRFPNLLIVAATQALFCFFILRVFTRAEQSTALDTLHFSLLILTTLLITAGGYVINDWFDQSIDQINKPEQFIIGKDLSPTAAMKYYFFLVGLGGTIALYLAFHIHNLGLFLIYPAAVGLLWWYSRALKCKVLSGNVVVALFTAFVPGIVWFAEREGFSALTTEYGIQMRQLFLFYMIFAFGSTLFREMIKDMEDMRGDRANGCRTLAVVFGEKRTKYWSLVVLSVLFVIIIYWVRVQWYAMAGALRIASILFLIVPSLIIAWQTFQALDKADYHRCSQWTKYWMISGLVYLLLFLL